MELLIDLCLVGGGLLMSLGYQIEKARTRALKQENLRLSNERDAYIESHNQSGHSVDMMAGWPPR